MSNLEAMEKVRKEKTFLVPFGQSCIGGLLSSTGQYLFSQVICTTASLALALCLITKNNSLWLQCACVHTHKAALAKWSSDFAPSALQMLVISLVIMIT